MFNHSYLNTGQEVIPRLCNVIISLPAYFMIRLGGLMIAIIIITYGEIFENLHIKSLKCLCALDNNGITNVLRSESLRVPCNYLIEIELE